MTSFYSTLVSIFPALYAALLILGLFYSEHIGRIYGEREPTLFRSRIVGLLFHICSLSGLIISSAGLLFSTYRDRFILCVGLDLTSMFESFLLGLTATSLLIASLFLFMVNLVQLKRLLTPDRFVQHLLSRAVTSSVKELDGTVDRISSLALASIDRFDRRTWRALHIAIGKVASDRVADSPHSDHDLQTMILAEMRYWDQVTVAKGLHALRLDTLDSISQIVSSPATSRATLIRGTQVLEEIARSAISLGDVQTIIRVFQCLRASSERLIARREQDGLGEVLRSLGRLGELVIDQHVTMRSVISDHELRSGMESFVDSCWGISQALESHAANISPIIFSDILSALGTRMVRRATADDNLESEIGSIIGDIRTVAIASAVAGQGQNAWACAYWLRRLHEDIQPKSALFRESPGYIVSSVIEIGLESQLHDALANQPIGVDTRGIQGPEDAAKAIISELRAMNPDHALLKHEMKEILIKNTASQKALNFIARVGGCFQTSFDLRFDWRTGEWNKT